MGNLFNDLEPLYVVIVSFILLSLMFDSVVILWGESRSYCHSQELKGEQVNRTTLCTIECYFWTKIVCCIFLHVFVSPQRCIGSNVQASHRCYHLSGMASYRQFSVCGIWLWRSGHAMGLSCRKRQRGWRKRKAVRCSTAITIHSYGKWWWVKCKLLRLVFSVQAE